jgi:hypothetical protein
MVDERENEVAFEDRRLAGVQPWREMDEWEESVFLRHLEVDFEGVERLRTLSGRPRVRTMDECGCLEFERSSGEAEPHRIVTDGYGPEHPDGSPFQTMLTLTGDGQLLWLEFHRFGGPATHLPDPGSLQLIRFGEDWPL